MKKFTTKNGETVTFRTLCHSDAEKLGQFFTALSDQTRSRFGPHPLSNDYAYQLCEKSDVNIIRYVVATSQQIIGYFIIDHNLYAHEKARYLDYGIELNFSKEPVFAPCICDDYQNQGVASYAMQVILEIAKERELKSLVLMGGTQAPNLLARQFYAKFGFKEYGEFFTNYNGLNNIDMKVTI